MTINTEPPIGLVDSNNTSPAQPSETPAPKASEAATLQELAGVAPKNPSAAERYAQDSARVFKNYHEDLDRIRQQSLEDQARAREKRLKEDEAWEAKMARWRGDFQDSIAPINDAVRASEADTIKSLKESQFVTSNSRIENTVMGQLISETDIESMDLGPEMTWQKAEELLTFLTRHELGMDREEVGNFEVIKNQLARLIWGKDAVAKQVMEEGKTQDLAISRGLVINKADAMIDHMANSLNISLRGYSDKLVELRSATTSPAALKTALQRAMELKAQTGKDIDADSAISASETSEPVQETSLVAPVEQGVENTGNSDEFVDPNR